MSMPDFGSNLIDLFDQAARRGGDQPFLWAKREGVYQPWSWKRALEESRRLARCLIDLGIEPGDRVLLVAENRPEWPIADLAIMRAGAISVPAYTTNTTDDHAYLLDHSDARVVILSGKKVAQALLPAALASPHVTSIIAMDGLEGANDLPVTKLSWNEALSREWRLKRDRPMRRRLALAAQGLPC